MINFYSIVWVMFGFLLSVKGAPGMVHQGKVRGLGGVDTNVHYVLIWVHDFDCFGECTKK